MEGTGEGGGDKGRCDRTHGMEKLLDRNRGREEDRCDRNMGGRAGTGGRGEGLIGPIPINPV